MKLKIILIFSIWSCLVDANELSFGYVPTSFPRDPVLFNQFDEHVVVGQILESLVDADGDGKIVPAIAKEWHFSADGKDIHFYIDPNAKFSNGISVTADDVFYSINRHLTSDSQSKFFLSDIESIKVVKKDQLIIHLKRNNASILKALTRDQLGIVPNGWVFKSDSVSPYVGTGPYNLVKKEKDWFLESNAYYKKINIPIKKWKLVFFKDSKMTLPEEIPSVIPVITIGALDQIKRNSKYSEELYSRSPLLGFTQTSFWVHPRGQIYGNKKLRLIIQSVLNQSIKTFCDENSLVRATGPIPKGIQGSLEQLEKIAVIDKVDGIKKIKIASLGGNFSKLFSPENIEKVKKKYGIQFEMKFFTFVEMATIQDFEPDIITGSWAGGFNDPAGFLALLTPLLGQDFKKYLGSKSASNLNEAETEQDFAKRSVLFRTFGQELVKEAFLTPGWRVNAFEFRSQKIINQQYQTRYTPRLINYTEAK